MRNPRQGFSLIELLVVMTAGSSIMLLAISLLQQSMRVSSDFQDRTDSNRVLNHLANQLRRDVWNASRAEQPTDELMILTHARTQVRYNTEPGSITRTETRNGEMIRGEVFRLSPSVDFNVSISESTERIEVLLTRDSGLNHAADVPLRTLSLTLGKLTADVLQSLEPQ